MAEHLSPLDATFLELEEADDSAHMHIGAVLVFDGDAPSIEEVREMLSARLDLLPRYRQRLSAHHTGGLRWPEWVEDERFDLGAHVRHATLAAPGDEAELLDWAADYWSHRLDRGRPLWEVMLVDGLAGRAWALVTKTHHCLVDGGGSGGAAPLHPKPHFGLVAGVGSAAAAHLMHAAARAASQRPPALVPAPARAA